VPYLVGQVYTSAIDVANNAGQPVTPVSATLTITQVGSAAAPATPPITPMSSHLSYDYLLPAEGLYRFDWLTQTPGTAQTEYVTARALLSVISLAEAREYLGINDTRWDAKLQSLASAATRLAEKVVGTIVPRQFTGLWIPGTLAKPIIRLPRAPVISVQQIASVYASRPVWQTADVILNGEIGTVYPVNLVPFWRPPWRADITAGRLVPSDDIIAGCQEILWDLWSVHRNLYGDSDRPDLPEITAFEAAIPGDYHIPGRAAELLEGERMPAFG